MTEKDLGSAVLSNGTATLNISTLGVGDHAITARYSGDDNFPKSQSAVSSDSVIDTVAGGGINDGFQATAVGLSGPGAVARDAAGDLFIADTYNNRIREVDHSTGAIATVAGVGTAGYSGDGGAAVDAELDAPEGIALDAAGDLFIADTMNDLVREVNHATGVITTVAGNWDHDYYGDGGPATDAALCGPYGVVLDAAGDLFIADTGNSVIREVNASTDVINTVAGNGTAGYSGDGKAATSAKLNLPQFVAVDAARDLFIADTSNNRIREVNAGDGTIATVAGNGTKGYSGDAGAPTAAKLDLPTAVVLDAAGNLDIADAGNCRVRQVSFSANTITTLVGDGLCEYSGDGGPAADAEVGSPCSLAADAAGDLFLVNNYYNVVRKVDGATGAINTVAGGCLGDGGAAASAALNLPEGIALDAAGNLFIADSANNSIRRMDHATGVITTVVGDGCADYSGDGGLAADAELTSPSAVAVDAAGNVFIADTGDNVIREVDHASGIITTFAGTGTAGYSGDGKAAAAAKLNAPERSRSMPPETSILRTAAITASAK